MQIFKKKVLTDVSESPNMKEIIDLEVEIPIYCFALLLLTKSESGRSFRMQDHFSIF